MIHALRNASTETIKITVRNQLIIAAFLLAVLIITTAYSTYALVQRTNFSTTPDTVEVTPDVHLYLGQKIEMKWTADRADWIAAYEELQKHKRINSDTQ